MADVSVLGIHPPATVRIDMGGWVTCWPWEWVELEGDRVVIRGITTSRKVHPWDITMQEHAILYFPYEHAREQDDGSWIFHGREDFTVTAGPAPKPSGNGNGHH